MHPAPPAPGPSDLLRWPAIDPLVLGMLVIATAVYTTGALRLWRRVGPGHGVRPWQAVAHGTGLCVLAVALVSPLDRASDALFSAHMIQHELLMLVAAPLIVLGKPTAAGAWALPRAWRVRISRLARASASRRTWAVLTAPFVGFLLHALTRWSWHLPTAFDAALADERVHAVQHITFFVTAMLFWWTLIHGRYGRAGYGVAVAFVFLTMLHTGLLAALIGLGEHPLYAAHAARSAALGFDPVADQQRAGLVMWIPAGVVFMALGIALFASWLGRCAQVARESAYESLR